MATFLDDYSKLSVVVPLPRKSDVTNVAKNIIQMLETQSGYTTQKIRTDNGGEYVNDDLESFFKTKGIIAQTTVRYTPEQNGAAERLNRTIMERVRAMLNDAKLPFRLWAEAAVTACYIRNRSPVSNMHKTPWELFYNSKPDVSHMRAFGSRAYVHVPKELRKKLDSHTQVGYMVGYAANTKGYRIYLATGKIVIARDVIFDETSNRAGKITNTMQESASDDKDRGRRSENGSPEHPYYLHDNEESPLEAHEAEPTGESVEEEDQGNEEQHGIEEEPTGELEDASLAPEPRYPTRERRAPGN